MSRRFEVLLEVHVYAYATWRYAVGHPQAGAVSQVERYERLAQAKTYVWDRERRQVRVG